MRGTEYAELAAFVAVAQERSFRRFAGHLAAGRLVRVLENWCQPFPGFFLYYPGLRHTPAALRALIDFL